MSPLTSDIAFTPNVKAIQQRLGARQNYQRMEQGRGWQKRVILFHIDAWDINCPQHITRRYTVEEFAARPK